MKNGRCRLHGGLSTGAKTAEGVFSGMAALIGACRLLRRTEAT